MLLPSQPMLGKSECCGFLMACSLPPHHPSGSTSQLDISQAVEIITMIILRKLSCYMNQNSSLIIPSESNGSELVVKFCQRSAGAGESCQAPPDTWFCVRSSAE